MAEYQLGKLTPEQMETVDLEVYSCERCRSLLESLDGIGDETTKIIALAHASTVRLDATESITPDRKPDDYDRTTSQYRPRAFGQYDLIRPIGQGGMGTVWLAKHRSLGREVAMKLLPVNRLVCERSQARFVREIATHGKLNHENLVQAFDAGEIDGVPYLAMELLNGEDAKEFCNLDRLLPLAEACDLVRQAAKGIGHAHEKGSIHRDVKPSNLRVTASGTVKVLDMGLARLMVQEEGGDDATAANQILGTVDYMAPEQFCDPTRVDERADVYSLGCTLFHLLTGRPPFASAELRGVIAKAVERNSQTAPDVRSLREEIPRGLSKLIGQALCSDPYKRPQSASALIQQLTPYCASANLAAFVGSRSIDRLQDQPSPQSSYRTTLKSCAAIAVCAACVLFIAWAWHDLFPKTSSRLIAQVPGATNSTDQVDAKNAAIAADPGFSSAINTALDKLEISALQRDELKQAVLQRPNQSVWITQFTDGSKAALVARKIAPGTGVAFLPGSLRAAQTLSLHELVRSEASRNLLAKIGYDDPQAADHAIDSAVSGGTVSGHVHATTHLARHEQGVAISVAVAKSSDIQAAWVTPPTVKAIGTFYRKSLLQRYHEAIERKDYSAALQDIEHLLSKPCKTASDHVSRADCLLLLQRPDEATISLREALDQSATVNDHQWFVDIGDRLAGIGGDKANTVAEEAYETALRRLQTTKSVTGQDQLR